MVRNIAAEPKSFGADGRRHYPVDRAHLARQTLGDPGLELEVLRMFNDGLAVYFGRIEGSTTVDDLVRNLHTLKGAAAGIGATAIAELARTAEDELRAGAPVNPERIDDIEIAVTECRTWISDLIAASGE